MRPLKLFALAATTALVGAGGALAQDTTNPALGPFPSEPDSMPAPEQKPEASPTPSSSTSSSPSQEKGVDAAVASKVRNHLVTIMGGIDAADTALGRLDALTSQPKSDANSVRRSTDLAKDALHAANVGCDRLDDMKTLSGEAETQVRAIEKSLHDARDVASQMGRESAVVRGPFTGGDAVRVRQMAGDARRMLAEARTAVATLASIYDIKLPAAEPAPVEKPAPTEP